jgi:hypothetical protein
MGKEKIIVDVPAEVKEKLKELAFQNRTNMTNMIIKLIEESNLHIEK